MPVHRTSTLTGIVAAALCTLALLGTAQKLPFPNAGEDPSVTPVAGPSWLTHLGLPINRTSLGQGSGRYGPPPDQPKESRVESLGVRRTIDLTGADLYRLNCQACHGESGRGTLPEIKSSSAPCRDRLARSCSSASRPSTMPRRPPTAWTLRHARGWPSSRVCTRAAHACRRVTTAEGRHPRPLRYLMALAKTPDPQHPRCSR
jgi:hypothetical protein